MNKLIGLMVLAPLLANADEVNQEQIYEQQLRSRGCQNVEITVDYSSGCYVGGIDYSPNRVKYRYEASCPGPYTDTGVVCGGSDE